MNAADTRASSAIAAWMALTFVPRSRTTAEIDTFMIDVSTTSTNIAMASRRESRWLPDPVVSVAVSGHGLTAFVGAKELDGSIMSALMSVGRLGGRCCPDLEAAAARAM